MSAPILVDPRVDSSSRSSPADPSRQRDQRLFRGIIVVYAALTSVPSFVRIEQGGRTVASRLGMGELSSTPLSSALTLVFSAVLMGICLAAICLGSAPPRRANTPIVALLVLTAMCGLSSLSSDFSAAWAPKVVLNLATVVAIWRLRIFRQDLAVFARVAGALAVASLVYAAVSDNAWMAGTVGADFETKALVGTGVLAGPYHHMNNLGMVMAIAIPFVRLIPGRASRVLLYTPLALVLVLSASRTAILATIVSQLFIIGIKVVRSDQRSVLFGPVAVLFSAICVLLPWFVDDPRAFTYRGEIWLASRDVVLSHLSLAGQGFNAFEENSSLSLTIGKVAGAAHNMVLHYWVLGGPVALLAVIVLGGAFSVSAAKQLPHSLQDAQVVLMILIMSMTEMPFRLESSIGQAWITLPALIALFVTRHLSSDTAIPDGPKKPAKDALT